MATEHCAPIQQCTPEPCISGSIAEKLEAVAISVSEIHEHSEPSTPNVLPKSFEFGARKSVIETRRSFSRNSHRSSSFMHSHRSKMSSEFTAQAESKFFALMEFMASASREATTLKEYWVKIIAEREAWCREREELCERITECTTELERRSSEHTKIDIEIIENKKHIEKITLELAAALACISAEKKKVVDCEHELEHCREELHEVKETLSCTKTELESTRTEFEKTEICLKTAIIDRDCARDDAEKHHKELQKVIRERTEIHSKLVDITSKYESSRKEIISISEQLKITEEEREEYLHQCDKLKDDYRKCKSKADGYCKEVEELTEKYERIVRETIKLKETIKVIETERDEYHHTIEHLRRDVKNITCERDEADQRCSEITLKYEHIKRELTIVKTKLREVESERTELRETLERTREELRCIIIERDELKDECHSCYKKLEGCKHEIVALKETLHKTEHTLKETRLEVQTLSERIRHIECERDESRHKCHGLTIDCQELRAKILLLEAEIISITETRESIRIQLEKIQVEYEELTETVTCHTDSTHELECEIDNLRASLREAREQKERAISARNSADRERDEYVTRYEEKCREFERLEEDCSHHHHHGFSREASYTERRVTGGTVIHNQMQITDQ